MRTPVRKNGRLRGNKSDAQRRKLRERERNQRQRRATLQANGVTSGEARRIDELWKGGAREVEIARRLHLDEKAVYRVRQHSRDTGRRTAQDYHSEQERRMHDIFTAAAEDGRETLHVKGIEGAALYQREDGSWLPNKPLLAALPALRGLTASKEQAKDTVARVVETNRLAAPAAGVKTAHVHRLESRAHALRDAISRFAASDRSPHIESGAQLSACARKLCGAAQETGDASRAGEKSTAIQARR